MAIRTPENLRLVLEGQVLAFADRIAPVYAVLNWGWVPDSAQEKAKNMTEDEQMEFINELQSQLSVPTSADIACKLFGMVKDITDPEYMKDKTQSYITVGGLAVFYEMDEDKRGTYYNCGIEFKDDVTIVGGDVEPELELLEGGRTE
jgi:hypothetical protein